VQCEVEDFCPLIVGLAPDEDFAVVGGGCEDVAVFGMSPGNGPYGAFVSGLWLDDGACWAGKWVGRGLDIPFQCLCQPVAFPFYLEDLDCAVRRAGREATSVVIENGIMLDGRVSTVSLVLKFSTWSSSSS